MLMSSCNPVTASIADESNRVDDTIAISAFCPILLCRPITRSQLLPARKVRRSMITLFLLLHLPMYTCISTLHSYETRYHQLQKGRMIFELSETSRESSINFHSHWSMTPKSIPSCLSASTRTASLEREGETNVLTNKNELTKMLQHSQPPDAAVNYLTNGKILFKIGVMSKESSTSTHSL